MMKASALICSLVLVGCAFTGVRGADAVDYQVFWEKPFSGDTGTWYYIQFENPEATFGQTFEVTSPFIGVQIGSPSWGGTGAGFTMGLYRWDTDYATTLAGTPVATQVIENYVDDSDVTMMFSPAAPAGQYLLHTYDPVWGVNPETGIPGHYYHTDGASHFADPIPAAYSNGIIMESQSVFSIGVAHGLEYPYTSGESFYTSGGNQEPLSLAAYPKLGQRFTATQPFDGIEVNSPTWGTQGDKGFTLSLWPWVNNYTSTVAQTPLASITYTGTFDELWYAVANATSLPAGVYFWEMSNPTTTSDDVNVGLWSYVESAYDGGEAYINGEAAASSTLLWSYPFDGSGTYTPFPFDSYTTMAQSFEITETSYGVGLQSPTWGGTGAAYRMTLYHWVTDYATSITGTPIAQSTFVNYIDDTTNKIEIPAGLAAGQYLLVTDEPVTGTEKVGHWSFDASDYNLGLDVPNVYLDGVKATDLGYNYPVFRLALGSQAENPTGRDFMSRAVYSKTTAVIDWAQY